MLRLVGLVVAVSTAAVVSVVAITPATGQGAPQLPPGVQVPGPCNNPAFYDTINFNLNWYPAKDDVYSSDDLDNNDYPYRHSAEFDADNAIQTSAHVGVHVPAPGVLANDSPNEAVGQVVVANPPDHAETFTLGLDGSFTWVPQPGWFGGDSFSYSLRDPQGVCYAAARVTIPPLTREHLRDDVYNVYNDAPFTPSPGLHVCNTTVSPQGDTGIGCGVLKNDLVSHFVRAISPGVESPPNDLDLAPLSESSASATRTYQTKHGSITLRGDGWFSYTPHPGYVGQDAFYYTTGDVNDGSLADFPVGSHKVFAKVTFEVRARPPGSAINQPDSLVTNEDTALPIAPTTLTANDPLASPIASIDGGQPDSVRMLYGTLDIAWNIGVILNGQPAPCPGPPFVCVRTSVQSMTYTPDADFHGADQFGYTTYSQLSGGAGVPIPTQVNLTVNQVIDAPQGVFDVVTVPDHTSVTVDVTANDYDPDGLLLRDQAQIVGGFGNVGAVNRNADGTFVISPNLGGTGNAGFTVQVPTTIGTNIFQTLLVNVTSNPGVDDAYVTQEDTPLSVPALGVMANDDPAPAGVTLQNNPEHGAVNFGANGAFIYTPATDFVGTDTFTYLNNGDPATVTVSVEAVADAPRVILNTLCPLGAICFGEPDNRGNLQEGDAARLRGHIYDPEFEAGSLSVQWGDGTTTQVNYPCSSNTTSGCPFQPTPTWLFACGFGLCPDGLLFFDLEHVYTNEPADGAASYPITVTATSTDGLAGSRNETAVVKDAPPTLSILSSNLTQGPGGNVSILGRVTDPGLDTGRLTVDWGDGTSEQLDLTCQPGDVCAAAPNHSPFFCLPGATIPSCGYFSFSHQYPDAVGSPSSYPIEVVARTGIAPDDTVTPGLTATHSATASVVVKVPTVSIGDATVVEGNAGRHRALRFPVTLSQPSTEPVTVAYTIDEDGSAGGAGAGSDFKARTGTVTFKPAAGTGKTPTVKYVTTPVSPDVADEGDETLRAVLSSATSGYSLGRTTGVGTIIDDDPSSGDVSVSVGDVSIVEGDVGMKATSTNPARVSVTLSSPATTSVTVVVTVAAGSASLGADFKKQFTKTITFKPGQRQKTVPIAVVPDIVSEGDETVTITLSSPGAGLVLGRSGGTATILDED